MSFALDVKEEIISHTFSLAQKKAFLSGFVKYNGELVLTQNKESLKLTTISNKIARNLISFCKEFLIGNINISIIQSQTLKKQKTFQLLLVGNIPDFLKKLHIYVDGNVKMIEANREVEDDSSLMRAYIAGIFIAVGSVNSPETTNYHLEVQFKEQQSAEYFLKILKKYRFNFKILKRNNQKFICYIKKTSLISDFIKLIDAPQSVMEFENERISRDMLNNINRIQNVDISNQTKAMVTGQKQIQQIKKIQSTNQFLTLSEKAQALAKLRLKHPDASYWELEQLMQKSGYQITKSGISYLFRSIAKLAK